MNGLDITILLFFASIAWLLYATRPTPAERAEAERIEREWDELHARVRATLAEVRR